MIAPVLVIVLLVLAVLMVGPLLLERLERRITPGAGTSPEPGRDG